MIDSLRFTVTYGTGSFANADGSVPTQEQVNDVFEKFSKRLYQLSSVADDKDIAVCWRLTGHTTLSEPVLAIAVVVPKSDLARERVIEVTDELATFVNESSTLKFDPKYRMIV